MPVNNLRPFFLISFSLHIVLIVGLIIYSIQKPQQQIIPIDIVSYLPKNIDVNPKQQFFRLNKPSSPTLSTSNQTNPPKLGKLDAASAGLPELPSPKPGNILVPDAPKLTDTKKAISGGKTPASPFQQLSEDTFDSGIDSDKPTSSSGLEESADTFDSGEAGGNAVSEQLELTLDDDLAYKRDRAQYAEYLKNVVNRNWRLLKPSSSSFDILYRVFINHKGTLVKLEKLKGTDDLLLQNSVEQSIKVSAPFKPLPESFPKQKNYSVVLKFTPNDL